MHEQCDEQAHAEGHFLRGPQTRHHQEHFALASTPALRAPDDLLASDRVTPALSSIDEQSGYSVPHVLQGNSILKGISLINTFCCLALGMGNVQRDQLTP